MAYCRSCRRSTSIAGSVRPAYVYRGDYSENGETERHCDRCGDRLV